MGSETVRDEQIEDVSVGELLTSSRSYSLERSIMQTAGQQLQLVRTCELLLHFKYVSISRAYF